MLCPKKLFTSVPYFIKGKKMKTNKKTKKPVLSDVKLAGGAGNFAAVQREEAELRRLVMANLLWEDIAYIDGVKVVDQIRQLVPRVPANKVAQIATEARRDQKLRHVPLLIAAEMCKYDSHKKFVREVVSSVCTRPDQMGELLSLYWNGSKTPIAKQLKLGLSDAFNRFDEYQLAKWNRDADIKLRDVMFLVHPKPEQGKEELFKRVADNTLATPNTWEVRLSACVSDKEKRDVWVDLIDTKRLGALAMLRNLNNMQQVKVPKATIRKGLLECSPAMLLPLDFFKAADYAPDYIRELEQLMFSCLGQYPKLTGETIFVLDVSGSMATRVSGKSEYSRMDAGTAMLMLAQEMCEHSTIYLTAGSDWKREHQTKKIAGVRGFGMKNLVRSEYSKLGGGGIFTRQCLDYIRSQEYDTPDRIIVFSDSQDCDRVTATPLPFGKKNYIVDVSSHSHGVNYRGVWDAEISGWSEHFMRFIHSMENS